MIKGIVIDLVEVTLIEKHIENSTRLASRILTGSEKEAFDQLKEKRRKTEFLAGRFAAKEAFAKAAGCGIGKLRFQDIEMMNGVSGAPQLTAKGYKQNPIFVSITHTKEYAAAQVVIEEN